MIDPRRYRPPEARHDAAMGEPGTEETDWEDNSASNALAWASATFIPLWCQHDTHWTARFANYLWTSCPCCMFFRGVAVALLLSLPLWLVLLVLVIAAR